MVQLDFAPPRVVRQVRDDGSIILRSGYALEDYPPHLGVMLRRWAKERPDQVFVAERRPKSPSRRQTDGWREVSYRDALAHAQALGQAFCERGLGPERPLLILSGNSVDHALVMLGGLLAGVPVVPLSPAYSLASSDHSKLRYITGLVNPGLIFVDALAPFANALATLKLEGDVDLVTSEPADPDTSRQLGVKSPATVAELGATTPGTAIRDVQKRLGPDTVAKILFTSGSTGLPKGVINTHRMLAANQQMIGQVWPFVHKTPPILVDWLPWSHTFGGNHNFNLVLARGGSLYIDGGKPAPGLVEVTAANLRAVSPTIYFNVPAGFAQLLPHLERDRELTKNFFRRLQMIFYAGAALSQDLWQRLEALSIDALGRRVAMVSAWGSTETAPASTSVHFAIDRAGVIGLPLPGVSIKMVPSGSKLELRIKGPNVTPGYIGDPELTRDAFDDEGFYRIGDAGKLADDSDPAKGLVFDGRVAEDFKLTSGTWVNAGRLRTDALAACAPVLQDAVVAGHDRDYVSLLAWLNTGAAESAELTARESIITHIRAGLAQHNQGRGSSQRIVRVLLMAEPPSIDRGEITDKGYVNQRAVLEGRAELVARLYAEPPDPEVVVVP